MNKMEMQKTQNVDKGAFVPPPPMPGQTNFIHPHVRHLKPRKYFRQATHVRHLKPPKIRQLLGPFGPCFKTVYRADRLC
jgi:hypothetical protein